MLNHVKLYFYIIIIINLVSCSEAVNEKTNYFNVSKSTYKEYFLVLNQLNDSVNMFVLNKFKNYEAEYTYQYKIDSLICFNKSGNRLIGCRHLYVNIPHSIADDLQIVLGEKINNNWYFFKTSSIAIPRSMIKDHPENNPLSYAQLHEIALKEVYGGYLNAKGEINEAWFISHFEGPGWGDFENQESTLKYLNVTEKFTDRHKFFEAIHLQSVRNNWLRRDTTVPIINIQENEIRDSVKLP